MMNPFAEVNWNPDRAARRKFAMSLMIGFPCLAIVLLLAGHFRHGGWAAGPAWLAVAGFAAGLILWLLPAIAKPFYRVWYFLGCCVGFVMGNLLLSLFFYLAITPVGWLVRISGRQSLARGFDRKKTTYWHDADKVVDPKGYFRQF